MAKMPEPYDRRTLNRNLSKGIIKKADYTKHLEQLPDMADNSEIVEIGAADGATESEVPASEPAPE